jgi:hypothetical protein
MLDNMALVTGAIGIFYPASTPFVPFASLRAGSELSKDWAELARAH